MYFPGNIPPFAKVASLFLRKVMALSPSDLQLSTYPIYKNFYWVHIFPIFSCLSFLDNFLAFFFHNRLLYPFLQCWPCWFIGLIFFSFYCSLCFPGHPQWSFLTQVDLFLNGIQVYWTPWTIPLSVSPLYPTSLLYFAVCLRIHMPLSVFSVSSKFLHFWLWGVTCSWFQKSLILACVFVCSSVSPLHDAWCIQAYAKCHNPSQQI